LILNRTNALEVTLQTRVIFLCIQFRFYQFTKLRKSQFDYEFSCFFIQVRVQKGVHEFPYFIVIVRWALNKENTKSEGWKWNCIEVHQFENLKWVELMKKLFLLTVSGSKNPSGINENKYGDFGSESKHALSFLIPANWQQKFSSFVSLQTKRPFKSLTQV